MRTAVVVWSTQAYGQCFAELGCRSLESSAAHVVTITWCSLGCCSQGWLVVGWQYLLVMCRHVLHCILPHSAFNDSAVSDGTVVLLYQPLLALRAAAAANSSGPGGALGLPNQAPPCSGSNVALIESCLLAELLSAPVHVLYDTVCLWLLSFAG